MVYNILIIGDGNLSYSRGLAEIVNDNNIVIYATTYDNINDLYIKYGIDSINNKNRIIELGHHVYHNIDGTNIYNTLINKYNINILFNNIIFMHPLICNNDKLNTSIIMNNNGGTGYIIANKLMLLHFLSSSYKLIKTNNGEIWITIKNVYPYTWWRVNTLPYYIKYNNKDNNRLIYKGILNKDDNNILNQYTLGLYNSSYYQPRNVENNKSFNLTLPITYVFTIETNTGNNSNGDNDGDDNNGDNDGDNNNGDNDGDNNNGDNDGDNNNVDLRCNVCDIKCTSIGDLNKHNNSRKHKQRYDLETKWINVLKTEYNNR